MSIGGFLNFVDGQIHAEDSMPLLKLSLYQCKQLKWNELDNCKRPSQIFHLLKSKGSEESALQMFIFSLEAIGGSKRGKHCVQSAVEKLGADRLPPRLKLEEQPGEFRLFYWLVKVARRLPIESQEKMKRHFGRVMGISPHNIPSVSWLFIELYQQKRISEDDTSVLIEELKVCKEVFEEGAPQQPKLHKCIAYLCNFHAGNEAVPRARSSGDEYSHATSLEESYTHEKSQRRKRERSRKPKKRSRNVSIPRPSQSLPPGERYFETSGSSVLPRDTDTSIELSQDPLKFHDGDSDSATCTELSGVNNLTSILMLAMLCWISWLKTLEQLITDIHTQRKQRGTHDQAAIHRRCHKRPAKGLFRGGGSFKSLPATMSTLPPGYAESEIYPGANDLAGSVNASEISSVHGNADLDAPISFSGEKVQRNESSDEGRKSCWKKYCVKFSFFLSIVVVISLIALFATKVWSPLHKLSSPSTTLHQRGDAIILESVNRFLTKRVSVIEEVYHYDSPHTIDVYFTSDDCHHLPTYYYTEEHNATDLKFKNATPLYMLAGSWLRYNVCASTMDEQNDRIELYSIAGLKGALHFDPEEARENDHNYFKSIQVGMNGHMKCTVIPRNIHSTNYYTSLFLLPSESLNISYELIIHTVAINITALKTALVGQIDDDNEEVFADVKFGGFKVFECLIGYIQPGFGRYKNVHIKLNFAQQEHAIAISACLTFFLHSLHFF